ncbi:MAG: FG-GAP repeat domain-containing protein, partial [Kiritimatiellia bacterium]
MATKSIGDGTFGTPVEFPASSDVWDVELIDYDKDGKSDVVATARNIDAVLLLQNTSTPGALSFVQQANIPVGDDPLVIATGDFNKDTWPDFVVSNYGTNGTTGRSISLLLNDQSGGFIGSLLEQGTMRAFGLNSADL